MSGREKRKLIPKSPISEALSALRDFVRLVQMNSSIPPVAYSLRIFMYLFQLFLPAFLPLNEELWKTGESSTRMMKLLSFFVFWGSTFTSSSSELITVVCCSGLFLILLSVPIVCLFIYKKIGQVPQTMGKIVLWLNDIIQPCLIPWAFAESATGAAILSLGESHVESWIACFLPVVLAVILLVALHLIYFPEVAYHPFRSIFWSGSDHLPAEVYLCVVAWLSRFCCMVSSVKLYIAYGIYCAVCIVGVVYFFMYTHFIRSEHNVMTSAILVASLAAMIVQFVRVVGVDMDQNIVIVVGPVVAIVGFIVFDMIAKHLKARDLEILDILTESGEEFDTFIHSPARAIEIYRRCFDTGHPYLLTWAILHRATELWPTNMDLWHQYLRFVAIYPTETVELIRVSDVLKKLYYDNMFLKGVRSITKGIVTSRSRHMSSALKHQAKALRADEKSLVNLMTAYWSAVSEASTTAVYDLCSKIIDEQEDIEASYLKLISQYPNNEAVYLRFASFLEKIEGDQTEAAVWRSRYDILKSLSRLKDFAQDMAMETFPALPLTKTSNDVHEIIAMERSQASRSSLSQSQASIQSETIDEEMMVKENEASMMRNQSLNMTLWFIDALIICAVLFFIVMSGAGPVIPSISLLDNIETVKLYWGVVKAVNNIEIIIAHLDYLLTLDTGRKEGLFLTKEQEDEVMNISYSTDVSVELYLEQGLSGYLAVAEGLMNSVVECYGQGGDVWQTYFTTMVDIQLSDTETVTLSLHESIEKLGQAITNYNGSGTTSYREEEWFEFFDRNAMAPISPLFEFGNQIYSALMTEFEHDFRTSKICVVVLAVVDAVFLCVMIGLCINIARKWKYVVESMAKLPKSAIHKVNARFSNSSRVVKLLDSERLYNNDFLKMATARSSYGGLPFSLLLVLCIGAAAVAMVSVAFVLVTVGDRLEYVNSIAVRQNHLTSFGCAAYGVMTKIFHVMSLFWEGKGFASDADITQAGQDFYAFYSALLSWSDGLLVGTMDESEVQKGFMTDRNSLVMEQASAINANYDLSAKLGSHDFVFRNPDFIYMAFLETLVQRLVDASTTTTKDSMPLAVLNHMLIQHYSNRIQATYSNIFDEYVTSAISEFTALCVGVPYAFSVVSLVLVIWLIHTLARVKKVIRYSISFLSVVDIEVVASNNALSDLVAGSFSTRSSSTAVLSKAITDVESHSEFVVLEVAPDLTVKSASPSIEEKWNLKEGEYRDIALDLLISFDSSKRETQLNTEVTYVKDQRKVQMNIYVYEIGKGEEYIYFFEDLSDRKQREAELESELAGIRKLKNDIMPDSVVAKVSDSEKSWMVAAKKVAIIAASFADFAAVSEREDAVQQLKIYRNHLRECMAGEKSVDHVKSVGITEYFIVNLTGDYENADPIDRYCVDLCSRMHEKLTANGMHAKFALTIEQNISAGLMNNDVLSFDVFARGMKVCRILSNAAQAGHILADKVQCPSLHELDPKYVTRIVAIPFANTAFQCIEIRVSQPDLLQF